MKYRIVRQIVSNTSGGIYYAVQKKGWFGWSTIFEFLPSLEIAERVVDALLNPVIKEYDNDSKG